MVCIWVCAFPGLLSGTLLTIHIKKSAMEDKANGIRSICPVVPSICFHEILYGRESQVKLTHLAHRCLAGLPHARHFIPCCDVDAECSEDASSDEINPESALSELTVGAAMLAKAMDMSRINNENEKRILKYKAERVRALVARTEI